MAAGARRPILILAAAIAFASPLAAQTAQRDGIAELIAKAPATKVAETTAPGQPAAPGAAPAPGTPAPQMGPPSPAPKDPREGEQAYEQARQLMLAIDAVLQDTAQQRAEAQKLPGRDEFILTPLWTETREDREKRIRNLLDSALGIVTDVPIVDMQKKVEGLRRNIRDIEGQIASLKEKQITAPKDGMLPGVLTDTVDSLNGNIADAQKRITQNQDEIAKTKTEIVAALAKAGVEMAPEQVDLLLDSVLSGDLVRLVAVFNAAKIIDSQLGKLLTAAGDNMNTSRKYFAMHAALFAMLVHAQDSTIEKIDTNYMPKLDAILKDIGAAQAKTQKLLQAENRPDQKRALEANRDAPEGGRGCGEGIPPLPAAAARADRQGAHARDARSAHRRQHLRDGGGELPVEEPDARQRRRPSRRSRSSRRRPSTRSSRTRSCVRSSRT